MGGWSGHVAGGSGRQKQKQIETDLTPASVKPAPSRAAMAAWSILPLPSLTICRCTKSMAISALRPSSQLFAVMVIRDQKIGIENGRGKGVAVSVAMMLRRG